MTLPQQLKELRGDKTFVEFARSTGINRQSLRDAEEGHKLKLSTVRLLAENLNLPEDLQARLFVMWVELQLGHDARRLDIRLANGSNPDQDLINKMRRMGKSRMSILMSLMEHPEMLDAIEKLLRAQP